MHWDLLVPDRVGHVELGSNDRERRRNNRPVESGQECADPHAWGRVKVGQAIQAHTSSE